jgi:hypothetical protein
MEPRQTPDPNPEIGLAILENVASGRKHLRWWDAVETAVAVKDALDQEPHDDLAVHQRLLGYARLDFAMAGIDGRKRIMWRPLRAVEEVEDSAQDFAEWNECGWAMQAVKRAAGIYERSRGSEAAKPLHVYASELREFVEGERSQPPPKQDFRAMRQSVLSGDWMSKSSSAGKPETR